MHLPGGNLDDLCAAQGRLAQRRDDRRRILIEHVTHTQLAVAVLAPRDDAPVAELCKRMVRAGKDAHRRRARPEIHGVRRQRILALSAI